MIKKTSLHKLNNNELNTLAKRLITAIQANASINIGVVAKILAMVITLNKQLTKSLNTSFKSAHAKILKTLDTKRDDAFRALRDYLLACSRRLNDVFRQHATKLITTIKIHGWSLWNENYQEESSKMDSLITDFEKEEAQASLTTLVMLEWFEEMKTAQAEFENAFQDKASDDIKKDFVAIKQIRPKLISNISALINRIDENIKYSENPEEHAGWLKTLNNIIEETAVVAKSRQTRNSNDDDE